MAGSSLLIGIVPVGNVSKIPMQDVMLGIQDVLITAAAHQGMPTHIRCGMVVDTPLPPPAIAWNDDKKKYNTDPFFNLAREINSKYNVELELSENVSLARGLAKLNVLYLAGTGGFEVSADEQSAMGKFLESGGVVIGEGCSAEDAKGAKEFGLAFNKLATQLKCKLESVQRGHDLLTSANIFSTVPEGAAGGMLMAGGRMIYSGSDYGCAWCGGYQAHPLSRDIIRSSFEIGINIFTYAKIIK